jgi:pyruvate dehydrogenase E1 component alpha subunit
MMLASPGHEVRREDVIALHLHMVRIRLVEERIAKLYPEQEMRCPVHLCIGQEATAAGVCGALERRDWVFGTHRSHGHYLAKGGDLQAMVAEIYGKATGCCRGKGGSMHLVDLAAGFLGSTPIVAATIPTAVGAALASQMRGEDRVTVAFFGDAAIEEGVFHEALGFAVLRRLPVVFACENNQYSVYTSLAERQPAGRPICSLARGHGLPAVQWNGNDACGVLERAKDAVARARRGGGPTFLELVTYRWCEHCGPKCDNGLDYRRGEEVAAWRLRCPIAATRDVLRGQGWMSEDEEAEHTRTIGAEIDEAFAVARGAPFPARTHGPDEVYATVGQKGHRCAA